jgi:hypothetical protein
MIVACFRCRSIFPLQSFPFIISLGLACSFRAALLETAQQPLHRYTHTHALQSLHIFHHGDG